MSQRKAKPHIRAKFSQEEDELLLQLIGDQEYPDWSQIAKHFPAKSPRQCRERYKNYINPSLNRTPWLPEEDEILLMKHSEIGPKWAQIASFLHGRTDVSVKNRYHSLIRHKNQLTTKVPKRISTKIDTDIIEKFFQSISLEESLFSFISDSDSYSDLSHKRFPQ